ncbi:hypothetical protein ACFWVC_33570 [Streptomyces sp. NPDC058691]|uniref:hypothetical protein n=1 Tax=Streptomyces sp. NPDC058691 TaxID=3346601 RepID=UPI0036597F2B
MSAEEIDFDVDLRELQGQAGVDTLCGFLCAVGRRPATTVWCRRRILGSSRRPAATGRTPRRRPGGTTTVAAAAARVGEWFRGGEAHRNPQGRRDRAEAGPRGPVGTAGGDIAAGRDVGQGALWRGDLVVSTTAVAARAGE